MATVVRGVITNACYTSNLEGLNDNKNTICL